MKKIISFTSKDFLSGLSEYPYVSDYGFWRTAQMNPYTKSSIGQMAGTIQPASSASNLTNGTAVVDLIQSFVQNSTDLYAYGAGGNFYKIADFNTAPTVSNLRAGSAITNPAIGLEVFRTKIGATPKVYYWRGATTGTGYIGELTLPNTWVDTKIELSPSYATTIHPILRISDTVYFGSGYVVSKIYDDLTNAAPALSENVLDLPTDHTIVSLETDGTYLIIAAQITNSKETKVYFWDYKNRLDSWTIDYTINDVVGQLKNIKGVIYAIGNKGLYYFNSATEPTKARSDISNSSYQSMVRYNDGLFIGTTSNIKSYGGIMPNIKTGVFSPFNVALANSMIFPSYTGLNYMFYSYDSASPKLEYQNITATPTSSTSQALSVSSSIIDLGQSFIIKRVDVIYNDVLASGQTITNVYVGSGLSTDIQFNSPSYTDYGATRRCELYPTSGELITDTLVVRLSDSGGGLGTNAVKRIDIYGEPSIK